MPKIPTNNQEKIDVLLMMYGKKISSNEGDIIVSGIHTNTMNIEDGHKSLSTGDNHVTVKFWFLHGSGGVREANIGDIDVTISVGWKVIFKNK